MHLIDNAVNQSVAAGGEQIVGIFDLRGFQVRPGLHDVVLGVPPWTLSMVALWLWWAKLSTSMKHLPSAKTLKPPWLQVPRNADFVFAAFMVRAGGGGGSPV